MNGHVFTDVNGNGTQDPGEADLVGVSVTITPAVGALRTTITDGNGNYSFTGAATGAAVVDVTDPTNHQRTTPVDPQTVTVVQGGNGTTIPRSGTSRSVGRGASCSSMPTATPCATEGEVGLPGASVTFTHVRRTDDRVVTDGSGAWAVTAVAAGGAAFSVSAPFGYVLTTGTMPVPVTIGPGTTTAAGTTGYQAQGSVSGHVFTDTDGDGTQSVPGEAGAGGVTVTVTDAFGGVRTAVTDGLGDYAFAAHTRRKCDSCCDSFWEWRAHHGQLDPDPLGGPGGRRRGCAGRHPGSGRGGGHGLLRHERQRDPRCG